MGPIFIAAIVILDVLALIDLFKADKDLMRKGLWTAVIVFLPLIGLILYFLVGKK